MRGCASPHQPGLCSLRSGDLCGYSHHLLHTGTLQAPVHSVLIQLGAGSTVPTLEYPPVPAWACLPKVKGHVALRPHPVSAPLITAGHPGPGRNLEPRVLTLGLMGLALSEKGIGWSHGTHHMT